MKCRNGSEGCKLDHQSDFEDCDISFYFLKVKDDDQVVVRPLCHCGRQVVYGFDGDPTHHRGMCADCDSVRCDAYPLECPYSRHK